MSEILEIALLGRQVKVWEVFAVIGVGLFILEIFSPAFVLLPIGLAFIFTAVAAMFLKSWLSVLIVLALSLLVLVWFFQSKIKPLRKSKMTPTNVDALVGKELVVTQEIKGGELGEAKLYGDRWTAYSISKTTYLKDEHVTVIKVDGNKVVVK